MVNQAKRHRARGYRIKVKKSKAVAVYCTLEKNKKWKKPSNQCSGFDFRLQATDVFNHKLPFPHEGYARAVGKHLSRRKDELAWSLSIEQGVRLPAKVRRSDQNLWGSAAAAAAAVIPEEGSRATVSGVGGFLRR